MNLIRVLKTYRIVFICSCLGILIWQQYSVFELYFQYKVSSTTRLFIPEIIEPLAINFCLIELQALDYLRLNQETGRNWSWGDVGRRELEYPDGEWLTIQEELKYTPDGNDIIDNIGYMKPKSLNYHAWASHEKPKMQDLLVIEKYLYSLWVCYKITRKQKESLNYSDVASAVHAPGAIFIVKFNEKFKNTTHIKFLIGPYDRLPFRGLMSIPYFRTELNLKHNNTRFVYNYYVGDHYMINTELMLPPYETRCFDYRTVNQDNVHHCREMCVIRESSKRFNRISFTNTVSHSIGVDLQSKQRITEKELNKNMTLQKELMEITEYCRTKKCSRPACSDSEIMTSVQKSIKACAQCNQNESIGLKHVIPFRPSFEIKTYESLSFVQLVIYALGSLATWTGLSILDMDPIKIAREVFPKTCGARKPSPTSSSHTQKNIQEEFRKINQRIRQLEIARIHIYRRIFDTNTTPWMKRR